MLKKLLITFGILSLVVFVGTVGYILLETKKLDQNSGNPVLFPLSNGTNSGNPIDSLLGKPTPQVYDTTLNADKPMNILLLGCDRRSREEAFRTDIMILLSINPKDKKVLLTSVPRDLWVGGGRINAVFMQSGWEGMKSSFEKITGQTVDRYILTDFSDFSWIVDSMDGVTVDVQTTFTDTEFPVDATKGYQTVTFVQGQEKLTGSRALIYARSRHGNNGEGSDWMRMKRQHLILKGMVTAVLNPKSIFNPMNVEKAYNTVTQGRMETNLTLGDAKFLWDFYKDKDLYTIESLYMDSNYVYNPPMADYGGAWVLIPLNNSYTAFHKVVNDKIYNIISPTPALSPSPVVSTSPAATQTP